MKTTADFRHYWLLEAIKEAGSQAKLARIAELNPAYLNQVKQQSANSKGGAIRTLGDEAARKIELGLKWPVGKMDSRPGVAAIDPELEVLLTNARKLINEGKMSAKDMLNLKQTLHIVAMPDVPYDALGDPPPAGVSLSKLGITPPQIKKEGTA